jgi:ChrR Cupin-like domain
MDNLMGIKPERGRIDYSFDDARKIVGSSSGNGEGSRSCMFFLEGHPGTTMVAITHYQPGHEEPPHSHASDYMAVILRGSYEVGRRVYREGDMRLQEAGAVYGPSKVGPDGCTQMVIFANPAGMVLDLPRERDRTSGRYDAMNEWLARIGAGEHVLAPNTVVEGVEAK